MKWLVPLLLILIFTACGGHAPAPVVSYDITDRPEYGSSTPPRYYVVESGDTLYSISWRYGFDYKTLAKINHIYSPYNIYKGQKLYFKTSKTAAKSSSHKTTTKKSTSKQTAAKKHKTTTHHYAGTKHLRWRWPTQGKVILSYSSASQYRKGINISGRSGEAILATASGKVVYSGNGLPRYGNLLIIKHNDQYLSAYAHSQRLLVKEGQIVRAGQKIATMGQTGSVDTPQLHFEIRRNGKPVNPASYLPKR